jgi:CheY-like chemotaxis protein
MVGVEVDAFSDGHAALDAIAARTPDAVLLDLNMPVDGFTIARAARLRFARTLRLVAFTGV